MIAVSASPTTLDAARVPYVTADEAYSLLDTELERFLTLVDQLGPDDWSKPTACTGWDVRAILAHQAGGYAGGASYAEFIRQALQKPQTGQLPEDAINAYQLKQRAGRTPAELFAELRRVGPVAARKWAYHFRLVKLFSIPHAVNGSLSLRHLLWVIHSRDTWMHRLDVCRAVDLPFEQTAEHDGRIAALVMRDVAAQLARKYTGPALLFDLTGVAGGAWKIGNGEPAAAVRMDMLDFNIFASGRYTYDQARPRAALSGDIQAAEQALKSIIVLY